LDPNGDSQAESNGLPNFLFFFLADLPTDASDNTLRLEEPLRLYVDESRVPLPGPGTRAAVVESGRASRNDVVFEADGGGVFLTSELPLRFVFSLRPRYERQISAGGVLARGTGEEIEFALMRTLPRKVAVAKARAEAGEPPEPEPEPEPEPADIEEGRLTNERRDQDQDRRNSDSPKHSGGNERRKGRSRRMRRRRRSSRWGPNGRLELPKGKLESGESPADAAVREACEELGITDTLSVHSALSSNHYTFRTPDGKAIFKTVHYFLLTCDAHDPSFTPLTAEGVVSVEWWNGMRAIQQVAFPNLKPVLQAAWDILMKSGT
jgi:8-oxo-dGTP pyrophosphatase MutT (NUDIX family)